MHDIPTLSLLLSQRHGIHLNPTQLMLREKMKNLH